MIYVSAWNGNGMMLSLAEKCWAYASHICSKIKEKEGKDNNLTWTVAWENEKHLKWVFKFVFALTKRVQSEGKSTRKSTMGKRKIMSLNGNKCVCIKGLKIVENLISLRNYDFFFFLSFLSFSAFSDDTTKWKQYKQ